MKNEPTPKDERMPISECNDIEFLRKAVDTLWQIIDDIDTMSDIAKESDKMYRAHVEKIQKRRWKVGIACDGYNIYQEASSPTPKGERMPLTQENMYKRLEWSDETIEEQNKEISRLKNKIGDLRNKANKVRSNTLDEANKEMTRILMNAPRHITAEASDFAYDIGRRFEEIK